MEGFLLVLSGPSGVGKGTIVKEILKKRDDTVVSISVTTRYKRKGEVDSKDYFFIDKDEFDRMVADGQLLESAQVHHNFYGTPKHFVDEMIAKGKVVILEIDVQGAMQIKKSYDNAVYVFVIPERMKDVEERLRHRNTEDEEKIKLRMQTALKEFRYVSEYDYFLLNDKLNDAIDRLDRIIDKEKEERSLK